MIEPQSAQDGESALTLKATFVPPPRSIGLMARVVLSCPFVCPFPLPLASTGSGFSPLVSGAIEVAIAVAFGGSSSALLEPADGAADCRSVSALPAAGGPP